MEHTLNRTLFIMLPNLTCFFRKKSAFHTCTRYVSNARCGWQFGVEFVWSCSHERTASYANVTLSFSKPKHTQHFAKPNGSIVTLYRQRCVVKLFWSVHTAEVPPQLYNRYVILQVHRQLVTAVSSITVKCVREDFHESCDWTRFFNELDSFWAFLNSYDALLRDPCSTFRSLH